MGHDYAATTPFKARLKALRWIKWILTPSDRADVLSSGERGIPGFSVTEGLGFHCQLAHSRARMHMHACTHAPTRPHTHTPVWSSLCLTRQNGFERALSQAQPGRKGRNGSRSYSRLLTRCTHGQPQASLCAPTCWVWPARGGDQLAEQGGEDEERALKRWWFPFEHISSSSRHSQRDFTIRCQYVRCWKSTPTHLKWNIDELR